MGEPLSVSLGAAGRFFREVGFPALVAGFVLWRLDGKVDEVVVGINRAVLVLEAIAGERGLTVLSASSSSAAGVLEVPAGGGVLELPGNGAAVFRVVPGEARPGVRWRGAGEASAPPASSR